MSTRSVVATALVLIGLGFISPVHAQETTAAANGQPVGQPRGRKSGRTLALTDLEADIDRLLFKAMAIGELTEVEDTLRRARRSLYGALTKS